MFSPFSKLICFYGVMFTSFEVMNQVSVSPNTPHSLSYITKHLSRIFSAFWYPLHISGLISYESDNDLRNWRRRSVMNQTNNFKCTRGWTLLISSLSMHVSHIKIPHLVFFNKRNKNTMERLNVLANTGLYYRALS